MSEPPIPRAPYHPDDLTRRLPRAAAELALNMFPDRVFAREVAPGEGLVDDHDRLSAFRVMVVEEPPRAQRDSHRAEVISAHLIDLRGRLLFRGELRLLINAKWERGIQAIDEARLARARDRSDSLEQSLIEGGDRRELFVPI